MNEKLQGFARGSLKEMLYKCTDKEVDIFKLMYSHKHPDLPIDDVVNNMPEDRLNWAMQQVQRTLDEK